MLRQWVLLVWFGLVLLKATLACAEDLRNIEFSQRVLSSKEGPLFEGTVWMKKGFVCVEFESGSNLYTSIIRDGKVYNFSTASSRGTVAPFVKNPQMPFGPEILQSKDRMKAFLDSVKAKKVRAESYRNQLCDVYEYTYEQGEAQVLNILWIWREGLLPLKSEMVINSSNKVVILYDDIKINGLIPDKRFNIPQKIIFNNS